MDFLTRDTTSLRKIKRDVKERKVTPGKGYLDSRIVVAGLLATTPDLGPCVTSRQRRGLRNTNKRADNGTISAQMAHNITNIIMGV